MPRHDHIRAVTKTGEGWPSEAVLSKMIEAHPILLAQLTPVFGDRMACEMVQAIMDEEKR